MSRFVFVLLIAFIFTGSLVAVEIPAAARKGTPGSYELVSSQRAQLLGGAPVRGKLVIPAGVQRGKAELMVFFHGATGNKAYYQNSVSFLERWAARDGFVLLSMQNPYGFARTASRETSVSIGDAIFAGAEVARAVGKAGIVDEDRIYAIGFSAGGMVASLSLTKQPDVFAGIGSFHGNFQYPGFFYGERSREQDATGAIYFEDDYETGMKKLKKQLRGKTAFLCVGGRDIPRVITQAAEARDFFKDIFPMVKLTYKTYPAEGHQFTEANWRDFLATIR